MDCREAREVYSVLLKGYRVVSSQEGEASALHFDACSDCQAALERAERVTQHLAPIFKEMKERRIPLDVGVEEPAPGWDAG